MPLAAIAMVTAVIAAFFYLRVAVLMYAPRTADEGPASGDAAAESLAGSAPVDPASAAPAPAAADGWASPEAVSENVSAMNAQLLLSGEAPAATGEETPSVVPVPALTAVAIGLCVAVTVVFGIWPEPVLHFASHATLLFEAQG